MHFFSSLFTHISVSNPTPQGKGFGCNVCLLSAVFPARRWFSPLLVRILKWLLMQTMWKDSSLHPSPKDEQTAAISPWSWWKPLTLKEQKQIKWSNMIPTLWYKCYGVRTSLFWSNALRTYSCKKRSVSIKVTHYYPLDSIKTYFALKHINVWSNCPPFAPTQLCVFYWIV